MQRLELVGRALAPHAAAMRGAEVGWKQQGLAFGTEVEQLLTAVPGIATWLPSLSYK